MGVGAGRPHVAPVVGPGEPFQIASETGDRRWHGGEPDLRHLSRAGDERRRHRARPAADAVGEVFMVRDAVRLERLGQQPVADMLGALAGLGVGMHRRRAVRADGNEDLVDAASGLDDGYAGGLRDRPDLRDGPTLGREPARRRLDHGGWTGAAAQYQHVGCRRRRQRGCHRRAVVDPQVVLEPNDGPHAAVLHSSFTAHVGSSRFPWSVERHRWSSRPDAPGTPRPPPRSPRPPSHAPRSRSRVFFPFAASSCLPSGAAMK